LSYSQEDFTHLVEMVEAYSNQYEPLTAYFPTGYLPKEIEEDFREKKFYHGIRVVILDSIGKPMIFKDKGIFE